MSIQWNEFEPQGYDLTAMIVRLPGEIPRLLPISQKWDKAKA